MSKKQKKQSFLKQTKRADGTTEYHVTKSPQETLWGKIIIASLAILLGSTAIISLILILVQAAK